MALVLVLTVSLFEDTQGTVRTFRGLEHSELDCGVKENLYPISDGSHEDSGARLHRLESWFQTTGPGQA